MYKIFLSTIPYLTLVNFANGKVYDWQQPQQQEPRPHFRIACMPGYPKREF